MNADEFDSKGGRTWLLVAVNADERMSFFRRREMRPNLIPRVGEQNNNRGGDRNGGGDKMAASI